MPSSSAAPLDPPSHFDEWAAIAPQLWDKQQQLFDMMNAHVTRWLAQPDDMDPLHLRDSWQELTALMWAQPDKLFAAQIDFWQRYQAILQDHAQTSAPSSDRRFRDPRWQSHPYFSKLRQSYELLTTWWQERIDALDTVDAKTRMRLNFALRQVLDAAAPGNVWWNNPEVLDATLQQRGQNLLKGLDQLLADFGATDGTKKPRISMAKPQAFELGKNLAMTPGSVVFENDLVQIIQYAPQTKTVHQTPLVIIAPWINKYYILDLQPENSFIQWAVGQGYTVFVTSWASATEQHRETDFTDYLEKGLWTAVDVACRATGEKQVNVVGYCIGGTLTTMGLAERAAKKQNSPIKSVTFFTTLIDFADAGELTLFTDEPHIARIEKLMADKGYLDAWHLHTTFNLLRANDLIWSFVVNNYLLGKEPFPFDLLHWNSDSTNIPARAHSCYLREMYLHNKLAQPNAMVVNDTPLDVGKIKTPAYFISAREDHIAPWHATYRGAQLWGGDVEFVLAGSGHIAGIVNPPAKNKYGYWTFEGNQGAALPRDPDHWLAKTSETSGSWWPHWERWLRGFSGKQVPAAKRQPGGQALKPIEAAPGRYVKVKALS
jgi:polyhydroxyalkanoate synthase